MKPAAKAAVSRANRAGSKQRPPRGSNTVAGAALALQNALVAAPECPEHLSLRPQDKPFWDSIMRARSLEEWAQQELVLAHQLARCQADIASGFELCDSGDRLLMEEHGFPSVHAVNQNIGSLVTRQLTLMRALQMVGAMVGDLAADKVPRRKAEREAEQTIRRLRGSAGEGEQSLLAL